MIEKIVNIYSFKSEKGINSYIYSLAKPNDNLGYDYYLLTKKENNEPFIHEASNAITLLYNTGVKLIPITKDTPEYKEFLTELLAAINSNSSTKQKVPVRK